MSTPHAGHLTAAITALSRAARHHFKIASAETRDLAAAEGRADQAEVWSALFCYIAATDDEITMARRAFEIEMTAAFVAPAELEPEPPTDGHQEPGA